MGVSQAHILNECPAKDDPIVAGLHVEDRVVEIPPAGSEENENDVVDRSANRDPPQDEDVEFP